MRKEHLINPAAYLYSNLIAEKIVVEDLVVN